MYKKDSTFKMNLKFQYDFHVFRFNFTIHDNIFSLHFFSFSRALCSLIIPPPTIGQTMSFHPPIIFSTTIIITSSKVNITEASAKWTLILFHRACPRYPSGYPHPLVGGLGGYPHRCLLDQHLKRLFQVKYFNVHKRCKGIQKNGNVCVVENNFIFMLSVIICICLFMKSLRLYTPTTYLAAIYVPIFKRILNKFVE